MKTIKFLFLLSLIFNTSLSQDSFELEIIMPKNVFITGEPVEIGINIKNNSNNIYYFEPEDRFIFEIRDSRNIILTYIGSSHGIYLLSTKLLKPEEEDYYIIELNKYYGKYFKSFTRTTYFEPDNYKLTIILNLEKNINIKEEINFSVQMPEGDEYIVFNEFKEIIMTTGTTNYNHVDFINKLTLLINQYPNTVYTPVILTILYTWYISWIKDYEKSNDYQNLLLEKYSWSGQAKEILKRKLKLITRHSDRLEFINKIKENAKNSIMERYIDKILKNEYINNSD